MLRTIFKSDSIENYSFCHKDIILSIFKANILTITLNKSIKLATNQVYMS